ncbi:MAG TPA: hypothetical protein VMT46_20090 [Anaerolineaceae bacterium]|nr:hypothetical protein [Anaerolineaceae bacterium]
MRFHFRLQRYIVRFLIIGVFFSHAIVVQAQSTFAPQAAADTTAPVITVWYGNNQTFGSQGAPQTWVNILGNVYDLESPNNLSLSFSLNGGSSQTLSIGPDGRRLQDKGDFNIEIYQASLNNGANTVVIFATNTANLTSTYNVTVHYSANTTWPIPYSINWSSVSNPQNVLQIVDGNWYWNASGIRTVQVGYDRVVAIGSMSWGDYEVLFPVTINAVDSRAYTAPNATGPGLGVNLHWTGHTNDPAVCSQPHCGWLPIGASNWYEWKQNGSDLLSIETPPSGTTSTGFAIRFTSPNRYWLRARVQTDGSVRTYYLKVWGDGQPEPSGWTLQRAVLLSNQATGSLILVAHYVDATFGNISVTSLNTVTNQPRVFIPLVIR